MLNHRITVLGITALLSIYVLWQAGSLVWKFWLLSNKSPQTATLAGLPARDAEQELLQNLLRYPVIRSAAEAAADAPDSGDQPITSLNLRLVGLMYSEDESQARAIIESPEEGARSFAVRERVADKAELYRIEPDRVILLHAGRQEALLLDPEEESRVARDDAGSRQTSASNDRPAATESQSATGQTTAGTSKKLSDVMREFTATPVMEDGELVGFHLAAVRNPEIMDELGIAPDDVITAVNGTPLNSQGRIMVLYDKLKKQSEFELTVKNGGEQRTITVEFDE